MKSHGNFGKKARGFTLVEIAIAMAIMALIAAATLPNMIEEINERRAAITIQDTQTILDAARVFRLTNGTWPGGAGCATAWAVLTSGANPLMAGVATTNKYNFPYQLSCAGNTFRVTQQLIPDWDSYVANGLPGTTITVPATNTIRSVIGVPGTEPAFISKLSRINTGNPEDNRMRTTMHMGGNPIDEASDITFSKTDPVIRASSGSLVFNSQSNFSFMNGTLVVNDVQLGWGGRLLSDAMANYVQKGTYLVRHGDLVRKPTCLNGGVPKASMRVGNVNAGYVSPSPLGVGRIGLEFRAIDTGIYWTIATNTLGIASDRDRMDSLVDTFCYYP